jgi:cytochrome c oxidase subunit 2
VNSLANPTAQAVDSVLIYIFGVSLLLLLGITVATIYLVIKYRRSKYPEPTSDVAHSFWLETIWTVLPTLIVLSMFWYGWVNYTGLREVPEDALEVKATARMWSWTFEYPDGRRDSKLYVPVGQPVKVTLYSVDVLHNFFIPAFRIKRDTVPGIETYIWFTATEPGSYDIFCAEYCGVGHADMTTSVEALSEADYATWAAAAEAPSSEPRGLTVMNELGCIGCHSLDGSDGIGPSLYQLNGQQRIVSSAGQNQELSIDEAYLKRAIREPNAELVEGYGPLMPAYDQASLSEEDLQAVVDYLLGRVTAAPPPAIDADELLANNGCIGCHSTDGSESIAPTFKGIGQRQVTVIRDGQELTIPVDADYLRKALLQPNAELVKGYPGIMPSADYLSAEEIEVLVQHLLKQ